VFVLRRRPGHPVGRLMLAAGLVASVAALSVAWSAWVPAAWLSQWAWWPPLGAVPVLLLLVPDGRLPSARWRPLAVVLVGAAGIATAALVAAAIGEPTTLLSDAEQAPGPAVRMLLDIALIAWIATAAASLGVLAALVVRWRAAGPLERGQLACLLPVLVLLGVAVALDWVDVPYGWVPAAVGLPLGLTLAVLLYRFEDLDLYVHRGVVWLVLTSGAVVVYAATVTVLGRVFTGLGGTVPLLAAAAVAAVLAPAHWLAQRAVGRLLYGRRDEPYAVMSTVGRRARAAGDPLAVLPEIATAVVDGLRVPYAAVRVTADDGHPTTAAEQGRSASCSRPPGGRASGSRRVRRRCCATWPTRRRWPPRRAAARWTCSGRATGSSWPGRRSAGGCAATCTTAWAPRWPARGCSPTSCAGPSSTTRRAHCWRPSRRTSRPAAPRSGS
jgi:two-component system, NarL family, sensor kinase